MLVRRIRSSGASAQDLSMLHYPDTDLLLTLLKELQLVARRDLHLWSTGMKYSALQAMEACWPLQLQPHQLVDPTAKMPRWRLESALTCAGGHTPLGRVTHGHAAADYGPAHRGGEASRKPPRSSLT
jgi:hypothetical protein